MLEMDPKKRIGVLDKNEIKSHPFFADLNWQKILSKEINPPNIDNSYTNNHIPKKQVNK